MARMLIAGCGFVGSALAEMLAADGHDVIALRRSESAPPAGATPLRADLTSASDLERLPPDVDVIFHTAAPDGPSLEAYRAAYVDGLRNVIAATTRRGRRPRRLLLTTSTAVYAQDHGEWVDEDSPAEPQRFQGRSLLESERIARDSGIEAVAVRFGGLYGPRRNRLIEQVLRGEAALPARPAYTNRIHRDDCAGVLRHLAAIERPAPVYLGVDHEPADRRDVLVWIAERLGAPRPPVEPTSPPSAGGEAAPDATGKRCRNDRLRKSGYRFRFPTFREGYEDVIAATRSGRG
jgi:nucleoside-diphosphate-sugar epimerase